MFTSVCVLMVGVWCKLSAMGLGARLSRVEGGFEYTFRFEGCSSCPGVDGLVRNGGVDVVGPNTPVL